MEFTIWAAIFWGMVVGIYELFAVHADENFAGFRWVSHGLQCAFFSFLFVFIVMNTGWFLGKVPVLAGIPFASFYGYLPVRVLIGLIAMFKIQAASVVVRGGGRLAARGMGEHLSHTFIAGLLIIFAPEIMGFIWPVLQPVIGRFLSFVQ